MAIDVWIGRPTSFEGRLAVSFNPEAYYAFLFPLFEELAKASGQMIYPYEGAIFDPESLEPVLEFVNKAQELISTQPEEFNVHMGTNLGTYLEPKQEEIFYSVKRNEYLVFISELRMAVLDAQRTSQPLVFFGD